jgi:hypothetical protein
VRCELSEVAGNRGMTEWGVVDLNTIRCEVISSSFKGNIRIFGYFDILGPNTVP